MKFTSNPTIFGIDPHNTSTDQKHPLGSKGVATDGRVYRYAENGAVALSPGKLAIARDVLTNHEDIAVNTFAIGDTSVTVTLGATAVTLNDYAEGYLLINDGTGEGISYGISGHLAADASASLVVNLTEPIKVAAAAATTVTLVANPYKDIIISDGSVNDIPVGVPNVDVAIGSFAWVQTGGIAAVLSDGTTDPVAGQPVTIGDATSGAVEVVAAVTEPIVGICPSGTTPVKGEYNPIYLNLDNS